VLSRKAVIEEENVGRKDETLGGIEEDIIVEGQTSRSDRTMALSRSRRRRRFAPCDGYVAGTLQNPAEIFRVGDTIR